MPVTFLSRMFTILLFVFLVPIEITDGESQPPIESHSEIVPTKKIEILDPALMPVCSCESTGIPNNNPNEYHFESDGITPIYGINKQDRGMCQINLKAHLETTKQMGLDILGDVNDYIFYSNWLFQTQGLTPWRYSKHCWGDSL